MYKSDVALIGLGPTGATLANLLGACGLNVEVFEKSLDIYPLPRAVHFDDEIMRVFQQIGITDQLKPFINAVSGMDLVNANEQILGSYRAPLEAGKLGWQLGYMFHQPDLERILRENLSKYPNIKVHLGAEVQALEEHEDGIRLKVQTATETLWHESKWVVGCCGAKSITRSALACELTDYKEDQPWLVIDIELKGDSDLPNLTIQYCDPARPCTYVPTPGNLRRFEIMALPGESAEQMLSDTFIEKFLSRWIQPSDYTIRRKAVYCFHALISKQWLGGQILLAGDAAHQMPPFLGQGMCSGIRDASNLSWKLDLVLKGVANRELLETYQIEREAHVQKIMEIDLWLGSFIQTTDEEEAKKRDHAMLSNPSTPLSLPVIPIGEGLSAKKNTFSRLPFMQPQLENGQLNDTFLGDGFSILGNITPSISAQKILSALNIKLIPEPNPEISQWLHSIGANAVLVRPDKYVSDTITSSADLDEALAPIASYLSFSTSTSQGVQSASSDPPLIYSRTPFNNQKEC